jgi:hypothetical protein
MPTTTSPQPTVLSAIQGVQAAHCFQHHSGALQVDPGCHTCLALHHAVQLAQPLAPPLVLHRATVVPEELSPQERGARHGR